MKRAVLFRGIRIEYELCRTGRLNVMLRVLPDGQTRVFAPTGAHLRDIDRFVADHGADILDMRRQIDESVSKYKLDHPVCDGAMIVVEGVPRPISVHPSPRTMCRIDDSAIHLYAANPDDDGASRAALRSALSRLALVRIRERLEYYAPRIGVTFGRVAIRDQRSRWGSCSDRHNLNFNWKLIMAPPEALDYVVIHELCHLIEFNHSPGFWALVENQMRDYAAWKKWLKEHGRELGI